MRTTSQIEQWVGRFGKEYTDRNMMSCEVMDASYYRRYGITREELNGRVLTDISRSARILEVGSNVGNQLLCLQEMGFVDLWGIEVQSYAVELSKSRTTNIHLVGGSAFEIPYRDKHFDLVFTSGVLIHIDPAHISLVMKEIHRCTREYIWGFEYFAPECVAVPYRGHTDLLWKADFARLYREQFGDLELVAEERVKYSDSENVDAMFLLRKRK